MTYTALWWAARLEKEKILNVLECQYTNGNGCRAARHVLKIKIIIIKKNHMLFHEPFKMKFSGTACATFLHG